MWPWVAALFMAPVYAAAWWIEYNTSIARYFLSTQIDFYADVISHAWIGVVAFPILSVIRSIAFELVRGDPPLPPLWALSSLYRSGAAQMMDGQPTILQRVSSASVDVFYAAVSAFPAPQFASTFPLTCTVASIVSMVSAVSIADRVAGGSVLKACVALRAPVFQASSLIAGVLVAAHALTAAAPHSLALAIAQLAAASVLLVPATFLPLSVADLCGWRRDDHEDRGGGGGGGGGGSGEGGGEDGGDVFARTATALHRLLLSANGLFLTSVLVGVGLSLSTAVPSHENDVLVATTATVGSFHDKGDVSAVARAASIVTLMAATFVGIATLHGVERVFGVSALMPTLRRCRNAAATVVRRAWKILRTLQSVIVTGT